MAQKVMKIHPLCRLFGQIAPLSDPELAKLTEDIKEHGIQVPILVNKKKDTILDGHTRWKIAHDLKLKLPTDDFEVFDGEDAEIEKVILSRNLYRRHMTDDQRVALTSKIRGPQLEKEAKDRQSAAGSFKGKGKLDGKGTVAEQIAKESGSSVHKAKQAEKARKAGVLDDVIVKGGKLRSAAKKGKTRQRTTKKKEVPFADIVYKKWMAWINKFPHAQRREVMKLVKGWIG